MEEKENNVCRLCGIEKETWEHAWKGCREWSKGEESWQEVVGKILGEEGEGEWWMRVRKKKREKDRRGRGGGRREE